KGGALNAFGPVGSAGDRLTRIAHRAVRHGDRRGGRDDMVNRRIRNAQRGKKLAGAGRAEVETAGAGGPGQPRRRAAARRESPAHFAGGRPSPPHVPRKPRGKDGERGERAARGGHFKKSFAGGPRKPREGGDKPFRSGPRPDGSGKPFRKEGYKPRTDRDGAS